MAPGLALCKGPRTRLPVGASALGFLVLCWLYVFPVYRLPGEKEIVPEVLRHQGRAWRRNLSAAAEFGKLLKDCCDPSHRFAMTKQNSPVGKNVWYDGEFLYYFTIDNETSSLFPKEIPLQLPLKRCSVVGNSGILKNSRCGKQIDQADFVMRCNLAPLGNAYSNDVGSKTQLVTANPSIINNRQQSQEDSTSVYPLIQMKRRIDQLPSGLNDSRRANDFQRANHQMTATNINPSIPYLSVRTEEASWMRSEMFSRGKKKKKESPFAFWKEHL